jgi:hypothetical protein
MTCCFDQTLAQELDSQKNIYDNNSNLNLTHFHYKENTTLSSPSPYGDSDVFLEIAHVGDGIIQIYKSTELPTNIIPINSTGIVRYYSGSNIWSLEGQGILFNMDGGKINYFGTWDYSGNSSKFGNNTINGISNIQTFVSEIPDLNGHIQLYTDTILKFDETSSVTIGYGK